MRLFISRLRYPVAAAAALTLIGGGVAVAISGVPEVDRANATLRLSASPQFTSVSCAGEDGLPYVTYRGGWRGTEIDVTPASTDYDLSGPITIGKVVWTVNRETKRGVLAGSAILTSPASGLRTYVGPLRLITQGVPVAGSVVAARGWLSAATYTHGATDGGSVLANVELQINGSFAAHGTFGDAAGTFGTPSYAVATANQNC
jgi:hypothetical protein